MGPAGISSRPARRRVLAFALGFALVSLLAPASALAVVRGITPPAITRAPVAPAGLPAPSGLIVTSGNMVDSLRWTPVRSTLVAGYRVERSSSASGPWTVVTARTKAASLAARVRTARTWYYRVRTVAKSGAVGNPSTAVSNETLALSAIVGSRGATLRASNGALTLRLPRGTFLRSTRVRIRPVAVAGSPSLIRVTSAYDFYASSALRVPARVTVRYRIPVAHFQVANTVARGIDWTYLNTATGTWSPVTTTIDTAAGTLTATMPHFSYWEGAYTQPHGTTPAKTDYCGTVCHDLSMSPIDASAISITDSEVCYHCHGDASASATKGVGTNGANIQAAFFACSGQSLPATASKHPVSLPGSTSGLSCTNCHNPHADPVKSPKLLRVFDPVTGKAIASVNATMPGTAYCWACHGASENAAADAAVPGYFTRAGDKKTTFNGAHTALGTATWRYDSEAELKRGYTSSTEVRPDGTVAIAGTIMLPKTPTPPVVADPAPSQWSSPPEAAYDGKLSTQVSWHGHDIGAAGASALNPLTGTVSLTIDLGAATKVEAVECYFYNVTGWPPGSWGTDVLEIQTSDDYTTWRPRAAQGTIGTRLGDVLTADAADTCRYVRFVFKRLFNVSQDNSIELAEISIYGPPTQGTYEVWPDIARNVAYSGGVVKWKSTESALATISVTARASTSSGTTWTAWQPMENGAALTQIPMGASLQNARLQVRSTLNGVGASPVLDSLEISMRRGAILGTTPQWSGVSPANQCVRCHTGHSSTSGGLVSDTAATAACKNCHSGTYGTTYVGLAAFAGSKHAAVPCADCHVAHGGAYSTGVDYAFLLRDDRAGACLACHTTVKAAFGAKEGSASEWAKHDIRSAEQVKTGSSLACRNCHGTHFSSTGLVNPDSPTASYTTTMADPTSIPTGEVVIYATKDTLLDSTQQTWNYGWSSMATITPTTRFLAYFDLSAIPAGATIQNATLVLWGSTTNTSVYTGGYTAYPLTRDWLEGNGMGTANSAGANGATWLEWKYGDNANTGNVASGDWTALGGDYASTPNAARSGINALTVTALVTSLRQGTNYGIMIAPNTADTFLPIYTRHNASAQYQPRLRVVYQTGPATRQVIDEIKFCSKCHDGSTPAGVAGQSMRSIGASYMTLAKHGGAKGVGPESGAFNSSMPDDAGGGYLKPPYSYGMDALPCTTCHDPHGSRLPYHLRETLNGRDMAPLLASGWNAESISTGPGVGYFCGACHVFPAAHAAYETAGGACFNSCHCSSH
ncbi:MAG: cytochrome c3 family protein [Coriobacteriia bacterium]|nr:cytochrome c3 family protein [Coriobacteriia bacterium]